MRRLFILFLFLLSGSAGLIYQVAWMRKLSLIFGVTSHAVSTVLAVFMGGLALGSWLLGRAGDDSRSPLRFYGWLELGIAVFGFQSVILLDGLLDVYVSLKRSAAVSPELFPLVRFLLACAVLIGPTTLMGGTLPVLIRGVCRTKERIARESGLLYAVNTLGAVAGTLFCAFYLVQTVGVRNTVFTAAAINLLVGLAALWLARGAEPVPYEVEKTLEEKREDKGKKILDAIQKGQPEAMKREPAREGAGPLRSVVDAAGRVGAEPIGPAVPSPVAPGAPGTEGTDSAPGTGPGAAAPPIAPDAAGVGTAGMTPADVTPPFIPDVAEPERPQPAVKDTAPIIPSDRLGKAGPTPGTVRAVVFAFGISGFLALAYEVLWTRYLIYVVGENSVYAFSMMLAAFLLGIVLGSLFASWVGDKIRDLVAFFGGIQVLIGAAAFGTVAVMGLLAQTRSWGGPDFWTDSATRFGRCLAVLIVPTTLSGTTFAIVAKLYARHLHRLGRDAGRAYAVNTLGAIFGAIAGGYLVLPYLKLRYGLIALGTLNVLVGLWILLRHRPEGRAKKTAFVTALFAVAGLVSIFFAGDAQDKLLRTWGGETVVFYEDGPESSVAITKSDRSGDLGLIVDGDGQAGTEINSQIHLRLLGHLPALFHPDPKEMLCVAFGAGFSVGCLAQHPADRVDLVELSSAVIRGSTFFEPFNHDPLNDPKVNLIIDDGRNYLLATNEMYDVITSDPIDPDDAGVTSLYAKEYYELVRSRLRDGGVACQWLTSHYDPDEYRMLIRTFQHVFPNASLWYADYTTIVVGLKNEPRVSMADLRARFKHAPVLESLEKIGISQPEHLLPLCLAGPDQLRVFTGDGPLNTDDRPRIEYLGPRSEQDSEDSEEEVWEILFNNRTPDLTGWMANWTEKDQADTAQCYKWMTWIFERHQAQSASWDDEYDEEKKEKDLSPDEKDRRFLERSKKRAESERTYLDITWNILGNPVPRIYLIMAGVGRHEEADEIDDAAWDAYDKAVRTACNAWQAKSYVAARDAFLEAEKHHPKDKRAPVMAAACLDKGGDPLAAMKALLSVEMEEESAWSEVQWFAMDLLRQVFHDMDGMDEAKRTEGGLALLEVTPKDGDRPEPRPYSYFSREDKDRSPKPRPTEATAGDVDAWRLWLRDASRDLEIGEGVFKWRERDEEGEFEGY